nr:hypothetical protein [uncultured Ruegeria sp.]
MSAYDRAEQIMSDHLGRDLTEEEQTTLKSNVSRMAKQGLHLKKNRACQIGWSGERTAGLLMVHDYSKQETPMPPGGR